jgi:hypothetical protein
MNIKIMKFYIHAPHKYEQDHEFQIEVSNFER